MPRSIREFFALLSLLLITSFTSPAWSTPPVLYTQPAYESPIHADPGDILQLSGGGLSGADTVVYQLVRNTTAPPPTPSLPAGNSALLGVLSVVGAADAPSAITVYWPESLDNGLTYAIWVVNPAGEWSAVPAFVNDARPLWITPDSAYQTAALANLPRVLKVVGRTLQPGTTTVTQVQLTGVNTGTTYVLTANNTNTDSNTFLERYVAVVNLPSPMVVDQYTVTVSRASNGWVPLAGDGQSPPQLFTVNPDPVPPAATFSVSDPRFADPLTGNVCQPNDGIDDTGCIILAIRAAQAAGGGTVTFPPGTWLMSQAGTFNAPVSNRTGYPGNCTGNAQTCGVSYFGVLVPVGVSLQGAGASGSNATIIERGTSWPTTMPLFTFQGNNTVSGFDFQDDNNYLANYANQTFGGNLLQLGVKWYFARLWSSTDPLTTSNVTITNNLFNKPWVAIGNGSLPADHIYITYNTFGGPFSQGIAVGRDEGNIVNLGSPSQVLFPYQAYHWRDTVVDYNTFYPSSFQVTPAAYNSGAPGGNGSIATGIDSAQRTDFSDNLADGTSTQYFYNSTDPKGFRAAFFFSTGLNSEMTLVSNNTIYCSGDKYGDGEAIVYDGDSTLGGTPGAEPVIGTAAWTDSQGIAGSSLTAQGSLATQFPNSSGTIDISSNPTPYYQGLWLQVVRGIGQGQWRKIESVSLGTNPNGPTFTLNVTPAFDVPPDGSSQIVVSRAYWQNVTVNNEIDQTTPLCTKANARDSGGVMSWYATTGDSAMEGNQQYGTSGILLNHSYQPQQPGTSPIGPGGFVLQSHNEVRNNLVSGSYDWSSAGLGGGIQLRFGATGYYCNGNTCPAPPPTNTGFGVSISQNTVIEANARDADGSVHPPVGAIGLNPGWQTGIIDPTGVTAWELDDDTLIFNNTLQNISNTVPGSAGGMPLVGIGIDVAQGSTFNPPVNWHATLSNNTCSNVDTPLSDFGLSTTRYCPAPSPGSCECVSVINDDVSVTASGSPSTVSAGGSATYTATVTNTDPGTTASGVTLAVIPSAGVQINGATYSASQGTCDSSVNICMLGSIPPNTSATVTVTGILPASGSWPMNFTVTHHEIDTNVANDGSVVTTTVP